MMEDLIHLLKELVSIDSINPSLIPGAAGEAEIARFAAGWLEQHGLEVHLEEAAPGRPNVVAVARGTGGGASLLLNSHMDTVGVAGMEAPFSAEIRDGRLYGRGALDTKGALAAFMYAAAGARKLALRGDVILAGVVDEEYASLGSEDLARRWHAEAAIVGEPTDLRLVIAHKGFVWLEVETTGVAAHGSRPQDGVDAIAKMGAVLAGLEGLTARLEQSLRHPLLGSGSIHAGKIEGGQEISSYPLNCCLTLERRTLPGETAAQVQGELQALLDDLSSRDPAFKARVRVTFERQPLEVPSDSPILMTMQRQSETVLGHAAEIGGVSFWTDAAQLSAAGMPTLVFGPSGEGPHAVEEWVDLDSVEKCSRMVLETLSSFCS